MKPYYILLYYCYSPIDDPEEFREKHHLFCIENNILGRVIVAAEGLNGTVSGLKENCERYMDALKTDERFKNIDFKVEESDRHGFQKLHVRVKQEIVHSSLAHIDPNKKTGIHLSPQEFKIFKDDESVILLDVRSNYEHNVGKFKNAVTLDIENFRDFPEKVDELEKYKNKHIVTYCTGGIKCEKASAYLLEKGFENVYQLHGGIIKYGIEEGGEDFEGKCYVFDNRVIADINKVNPVIISKCHICGDECDRMINCASPSCNLHAPLCEKCGWEMDGACSNECKSDPEKRKYDGTGYYQTNMNGYNPYIGVYRDEKIKISEKNIAFK